MGHQTRLTKVVIIPKQELNRMFIRMSLRIQRLLQKRKNIFKDKGAHCDEWFSLIDQGSNEQGKLIYETV